VPGDRTVPDDLLIRVTSDPIFADDAVAFVSDPGAGGTCVFLGTVRDHSGAGDVEGLSYEAWDELAARRIEEIADEASATWSIRKMAILHRTGDLGIGEISVVVAVSAEHRAEAFDACRHGIERLKQDVPIWKKEHLEAGESHWVMGS
jgi:molybdopterin synthase catalytic subunit